MARETWPAMLMITSSPAPDLLAPTKAADPTRQTDGHDATRAPSAATWHRPTTWRRRRAGGAHGRVHGQPVPPPKAASTAVGCQSGADLFPAGRLDHELVSPSDVETGPCTASPPGCARSWPVTTPCGPLRGADRECLCRVHTAGNNTGGPIPWADTDRHNPAGRNRWCHSLPPSRA